MCVGVGLCTPQACLFVSDSVHKCSGLVVVQNEICGSVYVCNYVMTGGISWSRLFM